MSLETLDRCSFYRQRVPVGRCILSETSSGCRRSGVAMVEERVRSLDDRNDLPGVYREIISCMYGGASPLKHLNTNTSILNWILMCTSNQCKAARTGVMCSRGLVRVINLAARFCTIWRRFSWQSGIFASRAQQ